MEKNNTTTYITAKKRMGCNAPIEVTFLAFIACEFLGFSNGYRISMALVQHNQKYCIDDTKILAKL
jgi:hypothetical protein